MKIDKNQAMKNEEDWKPSSHLLFSLFWQSLNHHENLLHLFVYWFSSFRVCVLFVFGSFRTIIFGQCQWLDDNSRMKSDDNRYQCLPCSYLVHFKWMMIRKSTHMRSFCSETQPKTEPNEALSNVQTIFNSNKSSLKL